LLSYLKILSGLLANFYVDFKIWFHHLFI